MVTTSKIYIRNITGYNNLVLNCWQDTRSTHYHIGMPEKFPCMAIEVFEDRNDSKDTVHIDEFVYLSDFPLDQPE